MPHMMIAEMLHVAGEALWTTVSLTAYMQHTAGDALLKMGSVVAESQPIAGEALLKIGFMIADMIAETQHEAGKSPSTLSPAIGMKCMLVC